MAFALPANFGYVAGAVVFSCFVHNGWMNQEVMKARKKYNVKYPDLYATKDNCPDEAARNAFNCAQRGHQNSLENHPSFLALLLTSGLQYPVFSATCGVIYVIGKMMYLKGYATGDPNKRLQGAISYIGLLGLFGAGVRMLYGAVTASLAK